MVQIVTGLPAVQDQIHDLMAKNRIVTFSEVGEDEVEMDSLECDLHLIPPLIVLGLLNSYNAPQT